MLGLILCLIGAIGISFGGGFIKIGINGGLPLLYLGAMSLVLGGIFTGRKMTLGRPLPLKKLPNDEYHKIGSSFPLRLSLISYVNGNGFPTGTNIVIDDLLVRIPDGTNFEVSEYKNGGNT